MGHLAVGKESVPMLGQAYAMPSSGVSVWLMLSLYTQCFPTPQRKKTIACAFRVDTVKLEFG